MGRRRAEAEFPLGCVAVVVVVVVVVGTHTATGGALSRSLALARSPPARVHSTHTSRALSVHSGERRAGVQQSASAAV